MRKSLIFFIIFVVGATGGFWYYKHSQKSSVEFVSVARGDIVKTVQVTGKVKSSSTVDLAFEQSGKVASVDTSLGDHVEIGQLLATQDGAVFSAQVKGAEADRDMEAAKLEELKKGARPEEVTLSEIKLQNAKSAFEDAKQTMLNALIDGYNKSDDAVRIQTDQMFSNARSAAPVLNVYTDSSLKQSVETERVMYEALFTKWKNGLDALTAQSDFGEILPTTKNNIARIQSFLGQMVLIVNGLTPTSSLSQVTIDSYRMSIVTARADISNAVTSITSAEENVRVSAANVTTAKQELLLKKAGPTPEALAAQEAKLHQLEARIAEVRAGFAKTRLYSPLRGIVTKQDAKVGMIVSPNVSLISLISDDNFEIEAHVPEVGIGQIQIGNPVSITVDAFPGEEFQGHVTHIDPAETVIDGVVNFKVTVHFDTADSRMKSGLTANLKIETFKKSGVLILSQFAVIETNGNTYVRVPNGKSIKDIPVVLGVRGEDGNVEIISGLNEGDRVINVGVKK